MRNRLIFVTLLMFVAGAYRCGSINPLNFGWGTRTYIFLTIGLAVIFQYLAEQKLKSISNVLFLLACILLGVAAFTLFVVLSLALWAL